MKAADVAKAAAEFIDHLEEEHGPDVRITGMALVVEVEDDGESIVRVDHDDDTADAAVLLYRGLTTVAEP